MVSEKKLLLFGGYKLYSAGGDLAKRWFIYKMEGGKRTKEYGHINRGTTIVERNEAAEKLARVLSGGDTAIGVLRAVADAYLSTCKKSASRGMSRYRSASRHLVAWCEKESVTLTDFTKTHAAQYLQETNNSYGQHARAIFAYAVEQGILDKSPFAKVSRSYTHTPAALMATEHKAILAAHLRNNDQILHLMTQVLYGCFIRPIEQLRLKRSAIDLAAGVIVVDSSISKNKKTQPVVIPDMLRPLLAAYMASTESYTYLFERKGKPYARVDTFQIKHTEAVAALGLPANYKLYSWKHTGAVAAARAGVPLKQLQLQLRHASLDQTDQYLRQMGIADMPDVRKGW